MSPRWRRLRRMQIVVFALASLLVGVACVRAESGREAPDPLQTDGDKYSLLLENPVVRVLRYHDEPGATTRAHHHPCFVMYALSAFQRELTFPDGKRVTRELRAGEAIWMPAQSHRGRNVGRTPTDALLIELKGPCP